MIRLIYNLLFPLGLLFFLPGYMIKMRRRGNYRRNFGQRFGLYSAELRARLAQHSWTWMHAVSVGEVTVALKLATQLRELDPAFRCVLTTTTTTGYGVAEKAAGEWLRVMYNPIDFLPIVRRAYRVIRPTRIILVEAEVWPNLAAEARHRRLPIALVNARLSVRSERRFLRFRSIVAPTFRCLDLVCVQEPEDVARWNSLGVSRERIRHLGSIKYDPASTEIAATDAFAILAQLGWATTAPVLLGGSTHPGEEEILAEAYLQIRIEFPPIALIIAPRHVERAPEVRERLEQLGLRVALRSEAPHADTRADCLLLDTTGELRGWYSTATIVFIGKSLTAQGGQNPVEPILAGKPVIFGPHMENFAALAASLVEQRGAIQITGADVLAATSAALLRGADLRAELVANAERVLAAHHGATKRTAALVLNLEAGGTLRGEAPN